MLNSKKKIEVAVVGLGIGEQHAWTYLNNPNCQLRRLYDLDPEKMRSLIAKLGQSQASLSFQELLEDEEIDLISIASYDDAHYEQTIAALKAGKHIFVEKPLCRSLSELKHIKQEWLKQKHLKIESNLVLRSAALYQWLKEYIQSGQLGQIYAIDGDYLYGRLHKITQGWRKNVENYSVMQGGGIHLVDLMLWLTGEKPTTVRAVGNDICTAETEFRYNDFICATFKFASGLIGRISANFGCVHRHQHVLRVFGTEGTFIYDDAGARLHSSRDSALRGSSVALNPLPVSKGDLIPPFVSAILANRDTKDLVQHNFNLISTCIAADRALSTHSPVKIEYA
ncbi:MULTISPECIES: Gfo/Idh/MocA family oxidoreductase [Spirulina sp. CCY15215]|uniref:Gfo/Idh/MocA family protein n=1 Tax=Spirulina sp. CCY15215 TaxID=2767591 RepID=UPI001952499E